jgi:ABC-type polysaccharide transport system permease subunit
MEMRADHVAQSQQATPTASPVGTRHDALTWRKDLQRHWVLYVMALPAVVSLLIFSYGPLFGLLIAFLDYSPVRGIFGSSWVGFDNFRLAFRNPFFWMAFRNSVIISALKLAIGFPMAIILALLLNEIRVTWFKRTVQTATLLPAFISWVVIATMFRTLLAPEGVINEVRTTIFGQQPILFLSDPNKFRWILVFTDIWKGAGYGAVIYLAAMAAIDPGLYEAAEVDGANRWQQTWYITLPGISTTIITLFILATGSLIAAGFEQVYVLYNASVYSTGDILETFTYRTGIGQGRYGLATAIGLFQAVIGFALVLFTNFLVKRFNEEGLF